MPLNADRLYGEHLEELRKEGELSCQHAVDAEPAVCAFMQQMLENALPA